MTPAEPAGRATCEVCGRKVTVGKRYPRQPPGTINGHVASGNPYDRHWCDGSWTTGWRPGSYVSLSNTPPPTEDE